jgi:diguanylate cyclase (GGDEF)-like protein/PAS domain S-box-containing protein
MPDSVQAASTSGQQDLQAEIARLNKIIQALMNRAERNTSLQGSDFNLFQTAITLEDQVRSRTGELEVASLEKERISRDLRESENHYRLLVENSPMSIHEIDRNGRITSMSMAGLRMRGVKKEYEVQGTLYLDVVCAADQERIKALFAKACSGETSYFEFTTSGSLGNIHKSCFVPIKDKNGHVEKLMGITEDITERKRVEQQLAEREALFRAIFDQASIGIELIDPETLHFIEVNPAACRMLGYTHEEFLHLRLTDTQAEMNEETMQVSMRRKDTADGVIFESRHRCKNGDILDVEVNSHMLNLSGKRVLVGIWRDITGYKRAQEEIELSNTILKTEQEVSPDAILVVDDNARIISYNQRFIELWRLPEQMVRARLDAPVLQAVIAQVEHPEIFAERVKYLYQHRDEKSREEIKLKDGQIIDRYSAPITAEDGKYYGRVWYFHDITERKKAEDQIRNLAFNDALTNIPNRRLLLDRLKQAMVASKRSGRYGAVMFLDLDNFKPLNDTHGHGMGDLLLIEVAHRISRCVREIDTVARFGGDEFVVMLSVLDEDQELSTGQAAIVAEKIRIALAEPYLLTHRQADNTQITIEHHCSSSIGVVLFLSNEISPEDVLKLADMAMYQAKEGGRNRVRFTDRKI